MKNQIKEVSYDLTAAYEQNLIVCGEDVTVDPTVRFVLHEDNGENAGKIIISSGARVRAGAIICSGAHIGSNTIIGHHVVLRVGVRIGNATVISHMTCVEQNTIVGNGVRISALSHLTGGCVVEDFVQIGARVVTVNDRQMNWHGTPILEAPIFRKGSRVGSGCTVFGGTEIGEGSFVGAHSLVTKSVPPFAVVAGSPAYIVRWIREDESLQFQE